ncbi:TetR/AcrR family transcriptional regulator [Herbiconiux solani]|uniref:TetR/AcrR family transcriptional regulator n=1 Tax=Herbiconiux solani TaxID=661329 RepID=UPI000825F193|nr:TetR/AcrR family transcriptional regulator [Herbiconiux solani]
MAERSTEEKVPPLSLVERKQRAARERIIDAADALFAERGFDSVSVTDIAVRAEVGRTTFFRHFGDKTEVVFAKEQAIFDAIAEAAAEAWRTDHSVDTLSNALGALEPLVLQLCAQATSDLGAYQRHTRLLDSHDELRARDALKKQEIAHELANVLVAHDAPPAVATLAAQLAVGCYASGHILAAGPGDLVSETRAAFRRTLAMGEGSTSD